MKSVEQVARDFDAIAAALEEAPRRERLTPAERALLRYVPPHATTCLDAGCGDGVLARAAARRGLGVLALDISPRMVALARARTGSDLRVDYRVADVMTEPLPPRGFDVVMSVNTVHHLPLPDVVPRLAGAVAPGGVLLIQDVVTRRGLRSFPVNAAAGVRLRLRRLVAPSRITRRVAALYEEHGAGEAYLRPGEVAPAYRAFLPDARVEHHLEWRYSVVWTRPRTG